MGFTNEQLVEILPYLKRLAMKLTRDQDKAQGLLNDCAVKALQYRDSFQEGSNLKGWTTFIMRNHFLSQMRRNKFVGETYEGAELNLVAKSNLDARIELSQTFEAMSYLTPSQRNCILLAAEGQTLEDIAEELRMEVGTVKSSIARGRHTLELYFR